MEILTKIALAFQHGGLWMWPSLGFGLVAVAIIVERTIALFSKRTVNQMNLVAAYEDNVRRGELDVVIHKAEAAKATMPTRVAFG